LEHFDYPELMQLLAECHRVLKPHGIFSVCVPDASIYINGYLSAEEFTPQSVYEPAFCINTKIDLVNYIAYMGGHHKYMFDRDNLLAILRKVGFQRVRARQFDSALDKVERDWESIYAEAEK
jgi:predicted SAM-dependent methyltransferase